MSSGNFQKAFLNNFTIFITLKENNIILHHATKEAGNYRSEPATIIFAPRIIFAHHHGHRRSATRIRCAFHQCKPASHHCWHEEQPESIRATAPLAGSHSATRTTMTSFTTPASWGSRFTIDVPPSSSHEPTPHRSPSSLTGEENAAATASQFGAVAVTRSQGTSVRVKP